MKKLLILVMCLGWLATGSTAFAFDIRSWCKQVSDSVGGSYVIEEGCIQNEKEARANVSRMTVPPRIMNWCTEVAESVGGSYVILEGCIMNELDSRSRIGD